MQLPTEQQMMYKTTAYTHAEVCAAIEEINAAYADLCVACGAFDAMFKARYFSRCGVYTLTDPSKIDSDYAMLAKIRDAANNLPDPSLNDGYNRSGGSQETYPVAKWQALTKRYRTAIKKMEKYL